MFAIVVLKHIEKLEQLQNLQPKKLGNQSAHKIAKFHACPQKAGNGHFPQLILNLHATMTSCRKMFAAKLRVIIFGGTICATKLLE